MSKSRKLDSQKETHLLSKYKMTMSQYIDMSMNQNNKCAICNNPESTTYKDKHDGNYRTRDLSVDHCHNTGLVRGLLCFKCNTALGLFKDDIELLNKSIKYLNGTAEDNNERVTEYNTNNERMRYVREMISINAFIPSVYSVY